MATPAKKTQAEYSMKFTIERGELLRSLARLQSIVEKRNTIPILSNVKLEADKDGLQLTVTDMDLVATEKVPAITTMHGSLTVPAGTFYDIVRKLPEGAQIELEGISSSAQLLVKSGSSKFALSYLPAEDFPVMSEGDMTHNFSLPAQECLSLIEKSRFAMSTEETRYYLNGVYLHVSESEDKGVMLKAVATDGHRLARIETALPAGATGMPGIIIPRKTVNELKKLIEEQSEEVEISLSETKIRFAFGNAVLLSKLVDGTFPDYARVIPDGNNKIMEVDAKLLNQAVDRVSTISTGKTRGIKFALSAGKLNLSAQSPESGFAEEEIDVTYSADSFEIGFNSRYVLEMLAQLEGDSAQFLFSDQNSPVLVTDPSDVRSLYVIMPMRV